MKIVIDAIDPSSCEARGYTEMASFLVRFRGSVANGVARLVPASGIADAIPGDEFKVEFAQESVSDFAVVGNIVQPGIVNMPIPGDFKVTGAVRGLSKAGNGEISAIYIAVGDATFSVTTDEMGGMAPSIGTMVEFIAHDVSMWDEVI